MILKKIESYCKNIVLLKENFDLDSWQFLSEILEFPLDVETVSFTTDGYMHVPRVFKEEQSNFIPIDKKSILGGVN